MLTKVLLTWELGGGYGHIAELVPIAKRLKNAGMPVAAALQSPHLWPADAAVADVVLLEAPTYRQRLRSGQSLASWSAILEVSGFDSSERLSDLLEDWLGIFSRFDIDAVVGNYSPVAMLAAKIAKLPFFAVGTGFHMPPATNPLPAIRSRVVVSADERGMVDQRVLRVINDALATVGHPPLADLAEWLASAKPVLCTFPELDHYAGCRLPAISCCAETNSTEPSVTYYSPLFRGSAGAKPRWPAAAGPRSLPRALLYLSAAAIRKNHLIKHLGVLGWPVAAHIRDLPEKLPPGWVPKNVQLHSKPYSMADGLKRCRLVICHAGHGTVVQALLAGKPLLLIPTNAEQLMMAERVAAIGAGLFLHAEADGKELPLMLKRLVKEPAFTSAAQNFACRYREQPLPNAADRLLEALAAL